MEVGTEKCLLSRVCPKLTAYLYVIGMQKWFVEFGK